MNEMACIKLENRMLTYGQQIRDLEQLLNTDTSMTFRQRHVATLQIEKLRGMVIGISMSLEKEHGSESIT